MKLTDQMLAVISVTVIVVAIMLFGIFLILAIAL